MGLFQPDWMSKDREKAMEGLKKIADSFYLTQAEKEKKLEKAALKARLPEIRLTAAKAVHNYGLEYQMAKQDPDVSVRAYLISEDSFYRFFEKTNFLELLSTEKNPDVRRLIQSLIVKKELEAAEKQRKKEEEAAAERKRKARQEEHDRKVQRVKEQLKNMPLILRSRKSTCLFRPYLI